MREQSPFGAGRPIAPPLVPASVYAIPDLDTLDRIVEGREPGFIYARDNHPNAQELAERLTYWEAAEWGLVTASGMGAISAAIAAVVRQGDRVLASDKLYGRSAQFLSQELGRFGVAVTYVDTCNLRDVERGLKVRPRVMLVETMSNPTLRIADIPALAEACRVVDCALMVDNTFATPVLCRPLEHGADLVMESLTKLIGGHSDLTLGFVAGRSPELKSQISMVATVWGMAGSAFDCWLGLRSLPTLELRVRAATANAKAVANWLVGRSGVSRVLYPGLPDHPDVVLVNRLFPEGPGNMIALELDGGRSAVNRLLRRAPGIPFSPSLGHTRTTLSHPASTSHRYVEAAERRQHGITDGLVRLSVGIEPIDMITEELTRGLG